MIGEKLWERLGNKTVTVISDNEGETVGLTGVVIATDQGYGDDDYYDSPSDSYDILVQFDKDEFDIGGNGEGFIGYGSSGEEGDTNCWWLMQNGVEIVNLDFITF